MSSFPSQIEIAWPTEVAVAARAWIRDRDSVWLDSAQDDAGAAECGVVSILGCDPVAVVEQFDGQDAVLRLGSIVVQRERDGWRLLRAAIQRGLSCAEGRGNAPETDGMGPGWFGYAGYEMGRGLERIGAVKRDDFGLPWLRFALFENVIVLHHGRRRAYLLSCPSLASAFGATPRAPIAEVAAAWNVGATRASLVDEPRRSIRMRAEGTPKDHMQRVERAKEYIAAGDIYQVNLAQRLRFDGIGDPFATYLALRVRNPAPYGALVQWDGGAIASVSPELFLELRSGRVRTCPIKGTRPRTGDRVVDAAYREELLASDKDAAELAMIVDLHRNDLGRVCAPGSIRVGPARRLETHPTVIHTVATVTGVLAPRRGALDLLAACFPAGSVTGVPKIRAMQIIDELEKSPRGAYTGAIGFISAAGDMTMNVAIRTLQIRGSQAVLHVGGGIVADSDPASEYEETLAKGRGIIEALGGAPVFE